MTRHLPQQARKRCSYRDLTLERFHRRVVQVLFSRGDAATESVGVVGASCFRDFWGDSDCFLVRAYRVASVLVSASDQFIAARGGFVLRHVVSGSSTDESPARS